MAEHAHREVDFPSGLDKWDGVKGQRTPAGVWLMSYHDGDPENEQSALMGFDEAEKLADWIKEQVAIGRAALSKSGAGA